MNLISVIVPIYNVEQYLPRCINSICSQTYRNLEILLINDGSTDKSGEICECFAQKDKRIKVIDKENGGLSSARNKGLEICTGEFISFVDSDDWIAPVMLETLLRMCGKYDAQIAECGYFEIFSEHVNAETQCSSKIVVTDPVEAVRRLHMWKNFRSVVWNKLYHKSVLEKMRFQIGKQHEDEFFTWRCILQAQKLVSVDVNLYFYDRTREKSITAQISEAVLDGLDAFEERLDFIWNNPGMRELTESINNAYGSVAVKKLQFCQEHKLDSQRVQDTFFSVKKRYEQIIDQKMPIEDKILAALEKILEKENNTEENAEENEE